MTPSGRPRDPAIRHATLRVAALPALALGLLLTAAGFVGVQRLERRYTRSAFGTAAARPAGALQTQFGLHLADLQSIRRLYLASQFVERGEFADFVTPILERRPELKLLAWAPRVTGKGRTALEAATVEEVPPGLRIRQEDAGGRRITAPPRDEYFPAWYVEPMPEAEVVLGLDLALDGLAIGALRRAWETGDAQAVVSSALVPTDEETILTLVLPVYGNVETASAAGFEQSAGQPVLGCLLSVLSLEPLVSAAIEESDVRGVRVGVHDHPNPRGRPPLVAAGPDAGARPGSLRPALRELRQSFPLDVAGEQWSVECVPTGAYTGAAGTWRAWWVLALGLLLSVLVAAYVSAVTGRAAWAERLVEERTADLSQANEALRESEERFRQLVERMGEGLTVIDADNGFTYVNPTFRRMLGYSEAEMLGRGPAEFMDEPNRAILAEQLTRRRTDEGAPYEVAWLRRSGRLVHTIISPRARRDASGRYVGSFAVITDITSRKLAEEQLERMSAELRRSNRELEQFAYVASHDLQEPLRKITAFGDRLAARAEAALDEHARDYLNRMQSAARRMQRLIDDLLLYSRVTTKGEAFVPVDLGEVTRGVLSDLEVRVQEVGAHVEVGPLPTIEADPSQMRQLLQNLIGNALKFRRPDQPPRVRVSAQVVAEAIDEPDAPGPPRELCRLTVEDNGIGFDPQHAERIFGVFQRLHTRDEYPGTGIGLAVCRRVVERHGGVLTAEGSPGRGATFTALLPVTHPREEPDDGEELPADPHPGGR
ncbi:MAG: PAS domain S-box protein [Armatimonadetes bacterium]|nr:PAS domain S-box protein [Armatimonadota bacterium]